MVITSTTYSSEEINEFELKALAQKYFSNWNKTQKPTATPQDLENYLSLLTDDVAWQHFPYQPDDTRKPDGKQNLRKGMTQWLGANTEYTAELSKLIIGQGVIVFKFRALIKFANSEGVIVNRERNYTDVLEIDNGQVSVIRRYGK